MLAPGWFPAPAALRWLLNPALEPSCSRVSPLETRGYGAGYQQPWLCSRAGVAGSGSLIWRIVLGKKKMTFPSLW